MSKKGPKGKTGKPAEKATKPKEEGPQVGDIVEAERDAVAGWVGEENLIVQSKRGEAGTFIARVTEVTRNRSDLYGQLLPHPDDLSRGLKYVDRALRALPTFGLDDRAGEIEDISQTLWGVLNGLDVLETGEGKRLPEERRRQIAGLQREARRLETQVFGKLDSPDSGNLYNILAYVKNDLDRQLDEASGSSDPIASSEELRGTLTAYRTELEVYRGMFALYGKNPTKKKIEDAIAELKKAEGRTTLKFARASRFTTELLEMIDVYQRQVIGISVPGADDNLFSKKVDQKEGRKHREREETNPILTQSDFYLATLNGRPVGCAVIVRPEKFGHPEGFAYETETGQTRRIKSPVIRYVGLAKDVDLASLPVLLDQLSDHLLEAFRGVYQREKLNLYYVFPIRIGEGGNEDGVDYWKAAGFRYTGRQYKLSESPFGGDETDTAFILRKSIPAVTI